MCLSGQIQIKCPVSWLNDEKHHWKSNSGVLVNAPNGGGGVLIKAHRLDGFAWHGNQQWLEIEEYYINRLVEPVAKTLFDFNTCWISVGVFTEKEITMAQKWPHKPTLRHVWIGYLVSFSSSMSSKSEFSTSSSPPFSEEAIGGIVLEFFSWIMLYWDALFMVEPASFWLEEMGVTGCEQVWWSLKQFYLADFL